LFVHLEAVLLDESVLAVASIMGKAAANFDLIEANYLLGNVYASIISPEYRSSNGIYWQGSTTMRCFGNPVNNGFTFCFKKKFV